MFLKKAFTLVEVVFVIVIIGIIALVAIPRLQTTRNDTKVATSLHEIALLISEMSSYYTTKGYYDALNLKDITNVKLFKTSSCQDIVNNVSSLSMYYYCTYNNTNNLEACISVLPNNQEGNLTIRKISLVEGNVCKGIFKLKVFNRDLLKTFSNGGSRIKY